VDASTLAVKSAAASGYFAENDEVRKPRDNQGLMFEAAIARQFEE
jgi:hypothetical protein